MELASDRDWRGCLPVVASWHPASSRTILAPFGAVVAARWEARAALSGGRPAGRLFPEAVGTRNRTESSGAELRSHSRQRRLRPPGDLGNHSARPRKGDPTVSISRRRPPLDRSLVAWEGVLGLVIVGNTKPWCMRALLCCHTVRGVRSTQKQGCHWLIIINSGWVPSASV